LDKSSTDTVINNKFNPIEDGIKKQRWPKECFDQGKQNKKRFDLVFVIITTLTFLELVYYMADSN
jgi:hypothetical protein